MINNTLKKVLVSYLHPCCWLTHYYGFSTTQFMAPNIRIMRPQKRKYNVPYRDFANFCSQLREQEQTEIKKVLQLLPQADVQNVKTFIKENKVQGQIFNIADNFEFLPQNYRQILNKNNIQTPSPIQQAIIPLIFEGNDVIAIAETGSGKTLAYALPGIMHIYAQPKVPGPRILVLAPTRELAQQIQTQYDLFTKTCCLYGGVQKQLQFADIIGKTESRKIETPNVIIATPGRLLDFIKDGLPMKSITQVVLDEADRMLDMGFEDQIKDVLKEIREDRQTLFFSATWPTDVQKLANQFCSQNPSFLQIGEKGLSVNKNIQQSIVIVYENKFDQFLQIIESFRNQKILIFCQRKMDTQKLEYRLSEHDIGAKYLHGDISQNERDHILDQFRNGRVNCLITTNLASRGLDVKDVDVVINYDFPDNIEDYIHRIGRTGRAGKKGLAISLLEPRLFNLRLKDSLIKVFMQSDQEVPRELLRLRTN